MSRLLSALAAIAVAALLGVGCGSDSLSTEEAREAFEGMPFKVSVHEPEGESGILVGVVRGEHGGVVRFAAVSDLDDPAVPPRLRRLAAGNTTGGGGWWVYRDGEALVPGLSAGQERDRVEISVALDDVLCRAATGDHCPI